MHKRRWIIFSIIICGIVLSFSSSTILTVQSQSSNDAILIESDDPQVDQSGTWVSQTSSNASARAYLYSSGSTDDTLTLEFEGTAVEIVYVKDPNLGDFAIEIDNTIVRTIVTHSDETTFDNRAVVDYLEDGQHTLRIYPVEGVIGIDAFWIAETHQPNGGTLISDNSFLFNTNDSLDIEGFFHTYNSPFLNRSEIVDDKALTAADIIFDRSLYYGINPKVVLVLIESTTNGISTDRLIRKGNLFNYVDQLALATLNAFQDYRYEQVDRNHIGNNAGTYAISTILEEFALDGVEVNEGNFITQYREWFGIDPSLEPRAESQIEVEEAAINSGYILPFPIGTTWRYIGGPHTYDGSGSRPWSSIDIAPLAYTHCNNGSEYSNEWVVSSGNGTLTYWGSDFATIEHPDGWRFYYHHIAGHDRRAIGSVSQGDSIGHPSCLGYAYQVHLHLSIWKNGVGFVDINGSVFSNWTVGETSHYNGTFSHPTHGSRVAHVSSRITHGGNYNNEIINDGLGKPGTPTITAPTANQVLSSPFDVTLQLGQLNHTGLYDFRIQIDNNSNFSSPEFDNNSNWSTSTTIPVTLAPGNYYIRAQQGDTQSQSSNWTSAVSFTVLSNTPILLNPIGTITNPNLNFEWFESSNSTWYHFVLSNAATNVAVIDQWYAKGSSDLPCSNGTCSLTPPISFAEGVYVWHVQGWDATNGNSNWSAPGNFTLDVPAPSIINKIEPDGNITSPTPTFTWDQDPNATWYHVWIGTSSDTQLLDQWYEGSSVCTSGTCTVDTGLTFIGDFKWFVHGYGAGGNGPWGSSTNFSYALTLISPLGTVGGTDLAFEWSNAGSTTTWYHLWAGVNGGNAVVDQWVAASSCNSTTCSYTATSTIPNGNYIWFVQSYGPSYGNGPWSASKNFTVSPISVDLQIQQQYDNDDPVVAGNTLTYTIIVENIGAFTATGVTLTDTLPTGVSYTSASQGCSHSSGIVTCNLMDLAPNDSTTININLTVNSNTHATITNTASVTSTETDTNPANNTDTESTVTFVHDGDSNDRGRLYFDQVVSNCTTTGKEERYYYWLAGDYTAPYIFDIQRTSGNLQYDIIVKRASGEWLVATHSSNEGRGIVSIELPQPGDFYIYLIPRPGTSGCYNINIHDNARPRLFYVYPNQSAHSDVQRWQFWLEATQTYQITTDRSDGDVEFTITLKSRSSGQTIATTTTVNGVATIQATSATGWYDVYLTPAAHTHGSYHITITQIN